MQTGFELNDWRINLVLVNEEFKNTGELSPMLRLSLVNLSGEPIPAEGYRKGKRKDGMSYQPQPKTNRDIGISDALEEAWAFLEQNLAEDLANAFYGKIEEVVLANWP